MKDRIKILRNHFGLTQQKFADRIGLKRQTIAAYEIGNIEPSDSTLLLICKEFNVNEHWLRTGEGEPYIKLQTNDIVSKAADLLGKHDPLLESIIDVYSKLDDIDKKVLIKVTEDLLNTYKSKKE